MGGVSYINVTGLVVSGFNHAYSCVVALKGVRPSRDPGTVLVF